MTFDLNNAVGDVAWAPYSSTVFAAVTTDGKVCLIATVLYIVAILLCFDAQPFCLCLTVSVCRCTCMICPSTNTSQSVNSRQSRRRILLALRSTRANRFC